MVALNWKRRLLRSLCVLEFINFLLLTVVAVVYPVFKRLLAITMKVLSLLLGHDLRLWETVARIL